jgi:8-oxo-dGTP pyrophosphatase MutT (NUDIX family)
LTGFLARVERLFAPIGDWGEFRRGSRHAAVAFILYQEHGQWLVPFVRRRADMRDHPGQVALPGGGVKPGESAWEAASREVNEELGVPAGALVPLGAGDPIYTSISNFSVVPFLAHLPDPVPPFVYDPQELDGVLAIPLDRLLDDGAWSESATPWRFRYLAHEESVVWGLTERMVAGLAPRLKQALAPDSGRGT